ncbi:hypothetical protein B5S33_g5414 [[Candida] boidinii]|nr:hypothetical protein B5S30_g3684 [[Candida] boidinii]OWB86704.1 hypothetical protein B5S33_g5414 [[Candida] boidinii]
MTKKKTSPNQPKLKSAVSGTPADGTPADGTPAGEMPTDSGESEKDGKTVPSSKTTVSNKKPPASTQSKNLATSKSTANKTNTSTSGSNKRKNSTEETNPLNHPARPVTKDGSLDTTKLRKSSRIPKSCYQCYKRKVKCNFEIPCNVCIARNRAHLCTREPIMVDGLLVNADQNEIKYLKETEVLKSKIKELENTIIQLKAKVKQQPNSGKNNINSGMEHNALKRAKLNNDSGLSINLTLRTDNTSIQKENSKIENPNSIPSRKDATESSDAAEKDNDGDCDDDDGDDDDDDEDDDDDDDDDEEGGDTAKKSKVNETSDSDTWEAYSDTVSLLSKSLASGWNSRDSQLDFNTEDWLKLDSANKQKLFSSKTDETANIWHYWLNYILKIGKRESDLLIHEALKVNFLHNVIIPEKFLEEYNKFWELDIPLNKRHITTQFVLSRVKYSWLGLWYLLLCIGIYFSGPDLQGKLGFSDDDFDKLPRALFSSGFECLYRSRFMTHPSTMCLQFIFMFKLLLRGFGGFNLLKCMLSISYVLCKELKMNKPFKKAKKIMDFKSALMSEDDKIPAGGTKSKFEYRSRSRRTSNKTTTESEDELENMVFCEKYLDEEIQLRYKLWYSLVQSDWLENMGYDYFITPTSFTTPLPNRWIKENEEINWNNYYQLFCIKVSKIKRLFYSRDLEPDEEMGIQSRSATNASNKASADVKDNSKQILNSLNEADLELRILQIEIEKDYESYIDKKYNNDEDYKLVIDFTKFLINSILANERLEVNRRMSFFMNDKEWKSTCYNTCFECAKRIITDFASEEIPFQFKKPIVVTENAVSAAVFLLVDCMLNKTIVRYQREIIELVKKISPILASYKTINRPALRGLYIIQRLIDLLVGNKNNELSEKLRKFIGNTNKRKTKHTSKSKFGSNSLKQTVLQHSAEQISQFDQKIQQQSSIYSQKGYNNNSSGMNMNNISNINHMNYRNSSPFPNESIYRESNGYSYNQNQPIDSPNMMLRINQTMPLRPVPLTRSVSSPGYGDVPSFQANGSHNEFGNQNQDSRLNNNNIINRYNLQNQNYQSGQSNFSASHDNRVLSTEQMVTSNTSAKSYSKQESDDGIGAFGMSRMASTNGDSENPRGSNSGEDSPSSSSSSMPLTNATYRSLQRFNRQQLQSENNNGTNLHDMIFNILGDNGWKEFLDTIDELKMDTDYI